MEVLLEYLTQDTGNVPRDRPHVCITWAQSLDGKLAAVTGRPTVISGNESMQMTHALRAIHDAILVGVGTVISDNPRLSCRIEPGAKAIIERFRNYGNHGSSVANESSLHPIPVILDSDLRTPPNARCLNATRLPPLEHAPLIFHKPLSRQHSVQLGRKKTLCDHAETLEVSLSARNEKIALLDLTDVLRQLRRRGVRTLMVEGGAKVISSFLEHNLWDVAIVTIAPKFFRSGVSMDVHGTERHRVAMSAFARPKWLQLGDDAVVVGFPESDKRDNIGSTSP